MNSETQAGLDALCARAREAFQRTYGLLPTLLVAAPGRVNLIGEHTDYNDGFVLPAAIDRHVLLAVAPRRDHLVRLHALDFAAYSQFSLDNIEHDAKASWSNYERGVAWALQSAGYALAGMDAVIVGDVPIGSGLSSSAAVEVATALAFQTLSSLEIDGVRRALLCQKAENEFVGMRCGIMDQYIISLGRRDHALLIDCRNLGYELVPIPQGCSLIVCDTNKRRGLVDSEYNTRRQECERGAAILGVPALRDVSPEVFRAREGELDEVTRKRCRHVVMENARVLEAVRALREGDVARFGELMNASHISLRDDYEVSCAELDAMVEAAWRQEGVLGARMTGAGFGGCTVNLVRQEAADRFAVRVAQEYTRATGLVPEIYICRAEEGVRVLS
ncbi:MAG: galactokinase [Chloroflexi bacterium]|nr:galactokinase [Chloroflexota bacterium]